jgi:DDE superfamily endonuclease
MAHTTEWRTFINCLTKVIIVHDKFKHSRDWLSIVNEEEEDLDELLQLMLLVAKTKNDGYRKGNHSYEEDLIQSPITPINNQLPKQRPWMTDIKLRQKYRMTRLSFHTLVHLIKDHPIFATANVKGTKQVNVEFQLMTLLQYLGIEGTSASGFNLWDLFKIGRGTSSLYLHCTMTVICTLPAKVVFWSDETERHEIANRIRQEYCFPNAIGFRVLFVTIWRDGQAAPMIIVYLASHQLLSVLKIIFWLKNILGDSAYENSPTMVSSYKCPKGMQLGIAEERFNTALVRPRMSREHTIGMLKGRFPWLRQIQMPVTEDKNSLKNIKYIDGCIILHNLLTYHKDPTMTEWYDDNNLQDPLEDYQELNMPVSESSAKDTRWRQLKRYINENIIL